jgi:hypothetical protein
MELPLADLWVTLPEAPCQLREREDKQRTSDSKAGVDDAHAAEHGVGIGCERDVQTRGGVDCAGRVQRAGHIHQHVAGGVGSVVDCPNVDARLRCKTSDVESASSNRFRLSARATHSAEPAHRMPMGVGEGQMRHWQLALFA